MNLGGVSNQAVTEGTGKSWQEWISILDAAGMQDVAHKDIVLWMESEGMVGGKNGQISQWWSQTVVVGYEYHHGRRVKGETADAGFQVGVSKTIDVPADTLWGYLLSDKGLRAVFGEGANADTVVIEQGSDFVLPNGNSGTIRVVKPEQKMRLFWQPAGRASHTTLQITLTEKGASKTTIGMHHEKLADSTERADMKSHWQAVLENIEAGLSKVD